MKKTILLLSACILTACSPATSRDVGIFDIKCYSGGTLIYQGKGTSIYADRPSDAFDGNTDNGIQFRNWPHREIRSVSGECVVIYSHKGTIHYRRDK